MSRDKDNLISSGEMWGIEVDTNEEYEYNIAEEESEDALDHMVVTQEDDDDGTRLTLRQIRQLINRAVMLMELDLEWDVDEEVEGNQWHQMPITELVERLGEDFRYKLIDEYQVMVSEGDMNNE